MNAINCKMDKCLSLEEKKVFGKSLNREGISENIFLVYENMVNRLSNELQFLCVKAYENDEIVGAAFFMRVQPVDIFSSISVLGDNAFLHSVVKPLTSMMKKSCAYLCMRSSMTANIRTPFFVREDSAPDRVIKAILSFLRTDLQAQLVMVMDSPLRQSVYLSEGFCGFPCPSEAILELKGYNKLSDYLNEHRSTKKHISPRNNISISLERDEVKPEDIEGMRACIRDSTRYARSKMPYGEMFMQRLLESDMFRSKDYLHVLVRVDGKIAGFHSFINCGSSLGAIVGGFNREVSQKNYVYERLIAATVDYAIQNRIERIHFGIVDNQTKLRLTNKLDPNLVYYFISSPVERWMMRITNKYTDVYKLFLLEERLKNIGIEN